MKHQVRRNTRVIAIAAALIGGLLITPSASASVLPPDVPSSEESLLSETDITDMSKTQSEDPTLLNFVPDPSDSRYNQPQPRSANGYQLIGGFTVDVKGVTVGVPRTTLWHNITGTGRKITNETANVVASTANICNYQVVFQNRYGKTIYSTTTTPVKWRCIYVLTNSGDIGNPSAAGKKTMTVERGVQCARLFINGVYAGEQCHSIS